MKMNNITLIGMPGAGKSTLGVVLAKILGYEFLDSDLLIQKEEKRRLYQIIDEEGEEGFKAIENRVNASIDTENTVIATGGSVVYCSEAMETLEINWEGSLPQPFLWSLLRNGLEILRSGEFF